MQLATIEELTRYWAGEYEMGRLAQRLNAFPQFVTEIDGLDIHFIHVKSPQENALPLILTHGWPGSIVEMLEVIGPLSDPAAHGGDAADAFHLVVPSIPGYGFSAQPAEVGWDPGHVAQAWAKLMKRLGYDRYVAQGGDLGAAISDTMALQAPDGLAGIHLNFLRRPPNELVASAFAGAPEPEGLTGEEHEALDLLRTQFKKGYIAEQGQSPQSIGYSLNDSPAGLAAWMLDHDTDSHLKISRAFVDGNPTGGLTRDHILDNITLYWVTAHRDLGRADVLGEPTRCRCRCGGRPDAARDLAAGRLHGVPRRDLQGPAQLGREGLPQPLLLQRGREGRPLRRLGGAGALHQRAAGGVQATAVNGYTNRSVDQRRTR